MKIKIDGQYFKGNDGETLMEVAKKIILTFPAFATKGFEGLGRCRLCIVEVKEGNRKKNVSACVYPIKDGIEVTTTTEKIFKIRKNIIMLLLLRSPRNEYIRKLAEEYKVNSPNRYNNNNKNENCILCGLCVKACEKLGTNAISFVNRGTSKMVSTPYDDASKDCIGCGACAEVCPTNAIKLVDENGKRTIWNKTFNLVSCSLCGKYYTTKEALNFIDNRVNKKELDYICENCKRKLLTDSFKESFKNIYYSNKKIY